MNATADTHNGLHGEHDEENEDEDARHVLLVLKRESEARSVLRVLQKRIGAAFGEQRGRNHGVEIESNLRVKRSEGANVDGNEGSVEVGRVEVRRPGGGGEAARAESGDEVGCVESEMRAVEAETVANMAQKVGDVADVALGLPDALSLRAHVLAVLRGGAMQTHSGEFLVVREGEGVCDVLRVQTVSDRNWLALQRKWEEGSEIARGCIHAAVPRITRAIAAVADRKNVSIEIGRQGHGSLVQSERGVQKIVFRHNPSLRSTVIPKIIASTKFLVVTPPKKYNANNVINVVNDVLILLARV